MGEHTCDNCGIGFREHINSVGDYEDSLCPPCSEDSLEDKGEPDE